MNSLHGFWIYRTHLVTTVKQPENVTPLAHTVGLAAMLPKALYVGQVIEDIQSHSIAVKSDKSQTRKQAFVHVYSCMFQVL